MSKLKLRFGDALKKRPARKKPPKDPIASLFSIGGGKLHFPPQITAPRPPRKLPPLTVGGMTTRIRRPGKPALPPLKPRIPMQVKPSLRPPRSKLKVRFPMHVTGIAKPPAPETKPKKPRWHKTAERPEGFGMPSMDSPPPGVEAFIDLADMRGLYKLMPASHEDTTTADHEVVDDPGQHCVCHHPPNASSWVAFLALGVLEAGRLAVVCGFWDGGIVAYIWNNDDDVIWWFREFRNARSKGKFVRGREGPSYLWSQPYIRLA